MTMRGIGMRKFPQSETAWEVSTAASSLESGYHSHSQDQLQWWSGQLLTRQKEEEEETKLDLLDSLILQDEKERLQGVTKTGSQSQLYLDTFIQHNIPLAFPGQVPSVQSVSQKYNYPSELKKVYSFMEQDIPLVFPGQLQVHSSQVKGCRSLLDQNVRLVFPGQFQLHRSPVKVRNINYSRELQNFRSLLDQTIQLVFPGQSQSVEEESPIGSSLPSSATLEPGDLSLTKDLEPGALSLTKDLEQNSNTAARKCPSPSGPEDVGGSGDCSPGVEDLVRLAAIHLQSLVTERAVCEEVLAQQIPGLSSISSGEVKVGHGQVEQLLEDAREEQERILSLTEKVELLTGVTQSSRLRQALESWQEDIRKIYHATTATNQDISSSINEMIRTIRTTRTFIWTLASTGPSTSY